MPADRIAKLREARIPPQAYDTTLELLKQANLRRIVAERAFGRDDHLVSYLLTSSDDEKTSLVFSRFACELVLSGQPLRFMRAANIAQSADMLNGYFYIAMPDLFTNNLSMDKQEALEDFLIDHVTLGGGLLLSCPSDVAEKQVSIEFSMMLKSSVFETITL